MLVPLLVLAALPLLLLRFATSPISDPDTLWHVVAGRKLWETWSFAGSDGLGHFAPLDFVYHQWLPELVFAAADAAAGLPGVAWIFMAMLVGFVATVYAACRVRSGSLAAVLATVLAWLGAGGSLSPRPQVLGFILLAISLRAWLRTDQDGLLRWWLIPLTWLWACVHGTWLYGIALSLVFGIGMLLDRKLSSRSLAQIALGAASMLLLASLTPVGPQVLMAPLAISRVSSFINEWKPAPIYDLHTAATLVMGLIVAVVWMRRRERATWTRMLLWAMAMSSALIYARTIAIGAILIAPLFAEVVQGWAPHRIPPKGWEVRTLAGAGRRASCLPL